MGARCPVCGYSDRGEAECPNCGFPLSRWRHRDPRRLSEEEQARYEEELSLARRRYVQNRLIRLEQRIQQMASPGHPPSSRMLSRWAWLLVPGYALLFALVSGGFRYILAEAIPGFKTWFSPEAFYFYTTNNTYAPATGCLTLIMGMIFLGWILLIFHDYEASA